MRARLERLAQCLERARDCVSTCEGQARSAVDRAADDAPAADQVCEARGQDCRYLLRVRSSFEECTRGFVERLASAAAARDRRWVCESAVLATAQQRQSTRCAHM